MKIPNVFLNEGLTMMVYCVTMRSGSKFYVSGYDMISAINNCHCNHHDIVRLEECGYEGMFP